MSPSTRAIALAMLLISLTISFVTPVTAASTESVVDCVMDETVVTMVASVPFLVA
jgi:ABC-type dipeptide/oligopeptide/nickel transport system permease subunit